MVKEEPWEKGSWEKRGKSCVIYIVGKRLKKYLKHQNEVDIK